MSETNLFLVAIRPADTIASSNMESALEALQRMFPAAAEIGTVRYPGVELFDCGQNFHSVSCPHCGTHLDLGWWGEQMSADYVAVNKDGPRQGLLSRLFGKSARPQSAETQSGFRLGPVTMPCCGKEAGLDALIYEMSQAFGRFAYKISSPGMSEIGHELQREVEELHGGKLTAVWQRI